MKCQLKTFYFLTVLQIAYCGENYTENSSEGKRMLSELFQITKYNINDTKIIDLKIDRNRSQNQPRYTLWSRWGDCNERSCVQKRRRRCVDKRKCGDTIQIEEKRCRYLKRRGGKRIKCGRSRQKNHLTLSSHRNITDNYHLEDRRNYRFKIIQKKPLDKKILPSKSSKWYSKWTRWSTCNRQCTTHRKRWCRRPKVCAADVIKETAYCYMEGSFCQRWINKKIRSKKHNHNGELLVDTVNDRTPKKERNDIDNSGYSTISTSQCGMSSNVKNSMYKKSPWYLTRIIGGRPTQRSKWPWQVAILNKYKEVFCGGTLVTTRWVLTAAHCIRKKLYVRLGSINLNYKDGIEMSITKMYIHPDYDQGTVDNDIALLRLPYKPYMQLGVACLPKPRQPLPTTKTCTIIGWGKKRITDHRGPDTLQEAEVPIVSPNVCKNTYYDYYISSNMFCAGYAKGQVDTCSGDSGGPLLCKDLTQPNQPWTIFGITSFGDGCGKKERYGIYARVPHYVRWINKVLKMVDDN